ncbi:MAG: ketol-acid reductoisomerase [Egibacteraceae bacterium]
MAMGTAASDYESEIFEKEYFQIGSVREAVIRGGRDLFPLVPRALQGVRQIGVIGWGSQGPAQAANLRDTLAGTDIRVKVGLREASSSQALARAAGFSEENGTLGEMFDVMRESQLILLLIADAAQVELHEEIFAAVPPGSTLGFSHGFLGAYLESVGKTFPANVNVVAVCPKGMGPSVRALYLQGRDTNGAGINASFAVHQDVNGKAMSHALGWAIALGSPFIFKTTLLSECISDLYGERGILLGAVHGVVECLYRHLRAEGMSPQEAFLDSCECITGPVSANISRSGILGVYRDLTGEARNVFQRAYSAVYPTAREVLEEIYDEVRSGNEIRSVMMASQRLRRHPMTRIDGTEMWQVGREVREMRGKRSVQINPMTAGVYIAIMMAQVDLLLENGHPFSEIANESVIECVDSLNPYMHARGVAYMVDNCSTTARLGARKWAPRFDYQLAQVALPQYDAKTEPSRQLIEDFESHIIHDILEACGRLRPSVDIFVK